jgi:hypothetical protein
MRNVKLKRRWVERQWDSECGLETCTLNSRRRKERLLTGVLFRNIQSLKLVSYISFLDFVYHPVLRKTREHIISDTGSLSVWWGGQTPTVLGPLELFITRQWTKSKNPAVPQIFRIYWYPTSVCVCVCLCLSVCVCLCAGVCVCLFLRAWVI